MAFFCYSRVVVPGSVKDINGHVFEGWGSHTNAYPCGYLTAAAAIGMTREDVDTFLKRLDKCLTKFAPGPNRLLEGARVDKETGVEGKENDCKSESEGNNLNVNR